VQKLKIAKAGQRKEEPTWRRSRMHWCADWSYALPSVFCFPLRLPVFFPSVFAILSLSLCFSSSLFFCLFALFIPLFFFLSLTSSSSLVRPLGSILFVYVPWFLFWVLSVFPFFLCSSSVGFYFFSVISGSSLPQFVPSGSILSVPPDSPSSSRVLLSTVFALFCYFPGILSSLLRFFCVISASLFFVFFSVLVPSLLFSSSPCVLPLFFLCSAGLRLPLRWNGSRGIRWWIVVF